jgi:peptidoglycan/LPS O-acetylase OafA/YrhL
VNGPALRRRALFWTSSTSPASLIEGGRSYPFVNTTIQNLVKGRQSNNLNAVRLLLAILVIVDHCFPLTLGKDGDPLFVLSHRQATFGNLAVDLFFFISGFLITASWLNCKSMNDYLRRRVLRIVPGYVVALVFSFLVASAFALHPFADLPSRLGKFKEIVFLGFSSSAGSWVFPRNPYPFCANGSLWTIKREFVCYLVIAAVGLFGFIKHRILLLGAFALCFACYCLSILKGVDTAFSHERFFTFFLGGANVWLWRDKIPVNHILAILALFLALITAWFPPLFIMLTPFTACYLVLWLGFAFRIRSMGWCDKTDLSYGVYLYAFPLQQVLAALGMVNPWLMFAIATPLTMAIAFLSWTFVEHPSLRLKSKDFSDYDPGMAAPAQSTAFGNAAARANW